MLLTNLTQLALALEAVEGVAEVLDAGDVILVNNVKFTPDVKVNERNPVTSDMSPWAGTPGLRSAKISFEVEAMGAAAAGTAPHYANAVTACGQLVTAVALTSITCTPASTGLSATLGVYQNGKLKKIWGARGTMRLVLEAGKPGILFFEFTGADYSITDTPMLAGVVYPTIIPPSFQNATLTIDAFAAIITRVEVEWGGTVTLRQSAAADSGHLSARITRRRPTIKFDPEDELNATADFYGDWKAGSLLAFSAAWGSDAGNTFLLTADLVQYQTLQDGEREGIATVDIVGLCTRTAGDDETSLVIT